MILKQGSQLMGRDEPRSIKITGLERISQIEGGQSLSERLGRGLHVEMGVEHVSEVGAGLGVEVLVPSVVGLVDVVGGA